MRTFLKLGLALAATLATGAASAQDKSWTTIRIATEGAYAPYNFMGPDGKLQGFEVDLAAELCKRMDAKCEVIAQDWDGIIPALQAGKYDAIMAGMSVTEKREAVLAFSRSYAGEPTGFGVPKDSPLAKMPENGVRFDITKDPAGVQKVIDAMKPLLKGKTIGVQVSTIHANFLDTYFKDTVEIREYKTTEQHDLDLLAGRIDGIIGSAGTTRATFERPDFKEFGIAGPRFSGGPFGKGVSVGLRKGDPELKAMFDGAIAATLADGTLKALSVKWFKSDITPQS